MYQIIADEEKLKEFIEWLPELTHKEKYLIHLQARKKYFPEMISSDKSQLKRILTSKKRMFEKIKQMECPLGSFTTNRGVPIPQEALVCYITPNPRCMVKASYEGIRELLKALQNGKENLNPHSEIMSCSHRCKSRSCYVHMDIDVDTPQLRDDESFKEKVRGVVGDSFWAIKTHGGYHLLVEPDRVVSDVKNWYGELVKILKPDQKGDLMLPIPGTWQGGRIPHFI